MLRFSSVSAAMVAVALSGCGVVPTLVGEGVRGAIDRTEEKRPASDPKVVYTPVGKDQTNR